MSRDFASGDYLRYATSEAPPSNVSLSAWINPDTVSGINMIFGRDQSGEGLRVWQLRTNGANLEFIVFVADTPHTATTSGGVSASAWNHAFGSYDGETVLVVVNAGTAATNTTPSGNIDSDSTNLFIGHRGVDTGPTLGAEPYEGLIAEVAMWSVALTEGERIALANRVSPLRIRTQSLLAYWPLYGLGSLETNLVANTKHLTPTGTTQGNHAPVQQPIQSRIWMHPTAAVVAADTRVRQLAAIGCGI